MKGSVTVAVVMLEPTVPDWQMLEVHRERKVRNIMVDDLGLPESFPLEPIL